MRKNWLRLLVMALVFLPLHAQAQTIAQRVAGKILLQVQQHGEAWYVYPETLQKHYLADGDAAYTIMRFLSLGISDVDLFLIPSVANTSEMNSSSSICGGNNLSERLKGRILLQVEQHGEAWYVDVEKCRRIYLRDGEAAYEIMRFLGLGITDVDLHAIPTASNSELPPNNKVNPPNGVNLNDGHDVARQALLVAINQERAPLGLPAMKLVSQVSLGAQNQANDITERQYFDFNTPEGKSFSAWVAEAGYSFHRIAENLAQTNSPVDSLVTTWKNQSPISYSNVISEQHLDLGVGVGEFQGIPVYTIIFAESLGDFFNKNVSGLSDLEQVRQDMLASVNQERALAGLPPMQRNVLLDSAAQGHTDDMLARAFYSHETPEGSTPHERMAEAGYEALKTAENIAKGQLSVVEVMEAWMNSASHRANILDTDFTEIGIGLSFGENANGYEILWAQEFGLPS